MILDFYHLTASPLERVLPAVAEKVLAGGGRLLVVAEAGLLRRLDEQLWSYAPDSFLPHGRESPEAQPILLSEVPAAANGAANIAVADGEWRDEALGFERAFFFFDGSRLDGARNVWRAMKGRSDVQPRYWKQDERGRWLQGP
ncbi:MAG: DNA polymerase III subunit chi [Alphaproteobacteria bacterium]|nr:DNA polymerase III subunit chi [Alphaproteobacteria bacterium]MBV9372463.1 DNA polymerase III subunit chi [Alphaproteobacteria bacterium]MBV9902138.1 DNA polymerase III subunit chi [Alphaproteobacteria bacterium]